MSKIKQLCLSLDYQPVESAAELIGTPVASLLNLAAYGKIAVYAQAFIETDPVSGEKFKVSADCEPDGFFNIEPEWVNGLLAAGYFIIEYETLINWPENVLFPIFKRVYKDDIKLFVKSEDIVKLVGIPESSGEALKETDGFIWNVQRVKDGWVEVIEEAGRELYSKLGKMPTATQVWIRLINKPPKGYSITYNKGYLIMPDENPLSNSELKARWGRYTQQT